MTARPPFVFHHKTGELSRDGKAVALCRLHADIFNCLMHAQTTIGPGAIAKAIGIPMHSVRDELPRLARRIAPLGIGIGSEPGRGKWLEFLPMPKWQPKIAPPVLLEGERPW